MSNYEKNLALRQGHGIASEDGYFEARPQIDSMDRRKVFGAGFERGWEAALAAAPAQERIDALELEVRQLTEQIAELRGGGAAKEYAELPESCYEDDSGLKTYDSGDMRTFADATHALRIQHPAPSAAPEEPLQAFDSPRAKSLMRAWEEGWEACRDAEYVGEEAQNDAFNSSHTLTLCLAEDQLLPTPQADSQPAPVREGEWINDAGRIKWLMWRVQDLEAKLAARAPADSVLEDAAQLERERICAAIKAEDDYCVEHGDYMLDSDDCIKIARSEWVRPDYLVDAARKQGANHD